MRDCFYQEFDIATSAVLPGKLLPSGASAPSTVVVTVTHKPSGAKQSFKLHSLLAGHDQAIEAQIIRLFPASNAAQKTRAALGQNTYQMKPRWQTGFVASVQFALLGLCDSPGANYWWNLLPTLPKPVSLMLYKRAGDHLSRIVGPQPLRVYGLAMRQAWMEVLTEACSLDGWRDVVLTKLHRSGWTVAEFEKMSPLELGGIAARCRLALLAIDFLAEEDWRNMLGFIVEPDSETESQPC